jgi:hypothetical protein
MNVQFVSYDLRKPGQDYAGLFEAIKALGSWWHCLESVWLVNTSQTSSQIRDALRPHLDANDAMVVAALGGNWAALGLSNDCADWLRQNLAR